MNILIFGDSIAQGLWDSKGGWADRLKATVQAQQINDDLKNYHEVFNLGVDGDTTKLVTNRFERETAARLLLADSCAFVFAVGTNDSMTRGDDPECTPEQYAAELNDLRKLAVKFSDKMLFVDLLQVDEVQTNPIKSSSSGKCYRNDRIASFNAALDRFCDEHGLPCAKVGAKFAADDRDSLLIDGLHPNDMGHELIYREVLPEVQKWLLAKNP